MITFLKGLDSRLLMEYNELLYDYYNNLIFYEEGGLEIIGNPNVRIGQVLHIDGADYNHNKVFYIEGYEDRFEVDEFGAASWTQTLTLTRGMEYQNLLLQSPDVRRDPLQNRGDFK
jgi:hypothetical protein